MEQTSNEHQEQIEPTLIQKDNSAKKWYQDWFNIFIIILVILFIISIIRSNL